MDEQLPWYRRLAVRVHLLYCVWCRRYASQVQFLRKAARELAPQPDDKTPAKLSDEAKDQIRQNLRRAANDSHPPQ